MALKHEQRCSYPEFILWGMSIFFFGKNIRFLITTMAAQAEDLFTYDLPNDPDPVVIVGAGPVGMHTANEIVRRDKRRKLVIYGNEPWEPYNRVQLSSLLAGELRISDLNIALEKSHDHQTKQFHNCAVKSINRKQRYITDSNGRTQPYSRLVLATGSSPHIPAIPGIDMDRVYTFRDLNDAQKLLARRVRSRRTIVLGGGLLGIETARAMQKNSTEVFIVEHGLHLMQRQLDETASNLLREHLLSKGIQVILSSGIKKIEGNETGSVSAIQLQQDRIISCDTIVIAAGIRPNNQLAIDCGLHIGNGIKVNDAMQTNDPIIFAVGECAEHRGQVYGLVAPGLEQASVAVDNILSGDSAYMGSNNAVNLKVTDKNIFSAGNNINDPEAHMDKVYVYQNQHQNIYRKLIIRNRKIIACVGLGVWQETSRIYESITHKRTLWPWHLWQFSKTGLLWNDQQGDSVINWPAKSIVCNCKSVTCAELKHASQKCTSIEQIAQCTGASTVCGSCKPLVSQFVGLTIKTEPLKGKTLLLVLSLAALLIGLLVFLSPSYPYSQSVQTIRLDVIWIDSLWKQISGFTLLGLSLIGLAVSLRKRMKKITYGEFSSWRIFHTVTGLLALVVVLMHTGLQPGSNLNFLLLGNFIVLALLGSIAAIFVTQENRLSPLHAKRLRNTLNMAHTIFFWPVPVLLGFHITSVYYF